MNNKYYHTNNYRGEQKTLPSKPPPYSNNKMDFQKLKKNTCHSLNEVECFLRKFNKISDCIKLYKILK